MVEKYTPQEIEPRWQAHWQADKENHHVIYHHLSDLRSAQCL